MSLFLILQEWRLQVAVLSREYIGKITEGLYLEILCMDLRPMFHILVYNWRSNTKQ
jgi:hypothetical protein